MHATLDELPAIAADVLTRLRAQHPRVHCVTNAVAQNFTANVLLAAGGVPSMTIAPDEITDFVRGADALLVNLGTFDAERGDAVQCALDAAEGRIPWVLDPVLIDRSPWRADFARALVARKPAAIRLNASELSALSGNSATGDPTDYANSKNLVVAASGETDIVSDGARAARIHNGHAWMAKVTAMGCAGSALAAACLAVEPDAWRACAASMLIFGVAGEVAAQGAKGPGTFSAAFLDVLSSISPNEILSRAKVS